MEKTARLVALVSSLWFGLAAAWEIGSPVGAGHVAQVASRAIIADNFLRWDIWGPVRSYSLTEPVPSDYYAHHPWGMFFMVTLFVKLLGSSAWVVRLVAVLMSAATPPLLYAAGRALWGPVPGAIAAASFATLPITLGFANLPGFEVPLVFGCALVTWTSIRFLQAWTVRWMVASVLSYAWFAHTDWEAVVFIALSLGALLVMLLLLPGRWFGPIDTRRFAQWWTLAVCVSLATVLGYLALFNEAGQLVNLFGQGRARSSGSETPLSTVLEARSFWIELTFTPLAIFLGKLALPVFLVRIFVLRRALETFPLAILAMATFQYVVFKNGADIHVYWPLPFAPYYALAAGVLAASTEQGVRWLLRRFRRRDAPVLVPLAVLGVFSCFPLAILPDGVTSLRWSHATGGRYEDSGALNFQDLDKVIALEFMTRFMEQHTMVTLHSSLYPTWSHEWALQRPVAITSSLPLDRGSAGRRYFVADSRGLKGAQLTTLAHNYRPRVIGPYWFVDLASATGPIEGHAFAERKPTWLEWYFVLAHEPIRSVEPDPYWTWELRLHFDQQPNPPPAEQPRTQEQRRIAHNLAVSSGDPALAERLRRELLQGLDRRPATTYSDGTELLGVEFESWPSRLHLYFLAKTRTEHELGFEVRSLVEQEKIFSLVKRDEREKKVGQRFALPPTLWRPRFIYAYSSEIRKRPGRERFYGYWVASGGPVPKNAHGADPVTLLTLP